MRRKITVIGLCVVLSFSMTACSGTEDKKPENNSTTINVSVDNESSSDKEETTTNDETTLESIEETSSEEGITTEVVVSETTKQSETTKTQNNKNNNSSGNKNNTGSTGGNTSGGNTSGGNTTGGSTSNDDDNDNYKILHNYEVLGSRYNKYKNAYKSGSTSGLSGDEITFYNRLKECLDQANSKSTKVEKEKAVHDWIILNCEYDEENYYNGSIPWSSFNPEGVFINGRAVCNGYALAFQLCMEILGIESKIIVGTASYDYHAWNIVKMDDGCWYHVDVTWDDPLPDRKGRLIYTYFNVTDHYISGYGRHKFQINETCNATKYGYWNYFEKDVLHVETIDQLYDGIINWIKNGKYEGTVAMEHNSSDFDHFNNAYDYVRVYKATNKEVTYKLDMIYEDNGTTHFPNGCAYAKFTVYDGSASGDADEEVIKYISSHEEYAKLIKEYSAGKNASRTLNIYMDANLIGTADFSDSFVRSIAYKAVQYVNGRYLSGNKTYYISMCFDWNDDTVTSIEQVKAKIDELYSAGVQGSYEINYFCGLSGDNKISISNELVSYFASKYNISGHGTYADPMFWRVDENGTMDSTYIIELTITGK